jgi:hypothetical protein
MSKTIFDHIRNNLHNRLNIPTDLKPIPNAKFVNLKNTEWCGEFEINMRNRLIMGAMRYGKMNAPNKPKYDRVSDMIRRLKEYGLSGNLENLVDVANLAMMEYVEGEHPNRHFESSDDGEHTKECNDG